VPSAAFKRFRLSFFEDPDSARQGLDKAALAQLDGEERAQAEDMLLRYLPDARGIIGLGVLRSQRAKPALAALFDSEQKARRENRLYPDGDWLPHILIYSAKALWQIRPDPRWLPAMIDVLASSAESVMRQEAAEVLYGVHDSAAARAFVAALDDPEALVRYHATRGLLAIYGLSTESKDLEHMMYRVMSDDPVRREGGKRDILAAIAGRPIASP
jgi:HEAT repeat protein